MAIPEFITYDFDADLMDCSCGNTTHTDGFIAVDDNGIECEPTKGIWNGRFMCQTCGATITLPEEQRGYTGEVIDITPRGCETEEGQARVNAAMKAFDEAREEVARVATSMLKDGHLHSLLLSVSHEKNFGAVDAITELITATEARLKAEEAFLHAVAGK